MVDSKIVLLFVPLGAAVLWFLGKKESDEIIVQATESPTHTLSESKTDWIVQTSNRQAVPIDEVNLPNVKVSFGESEAGVVIREIAYDKKHYSLEQVQNLIRDKLSNCPRCKIYP